MLGYPNSVGRGNPATWWGGYGTYWQFFVQDDIKVSSRLTLNVGLRYKYNPWLKGYRGQVATFDPVSLPRAPIAQPRALSTSIFNWIRAEPDRAE
jgi:hypothetical protein